MSTGVRFDRTWNKFLKISRQLPNDISQKLTPHFQETPTQPMCEFLAQFVLELLKENTSQDRSQRLKCWKHSLQNSDRNIFKWTKKKPKTTHDKLSQTSDGFTCNYQARLTRTSQVQVWKDIYSMHKQGGPTLRAFPAEYGTSAHHCAGYLSYSENFQE